MMLIQSITYFIPLSQHCSHALFKRHLETKIESHMRNLRLLRLSMGEPLIKNAGTIGQGANGPPNREEADIAYTHAMNLRLG